jgi:enamine deaminase RidA (YjgF/YER057c/UK114 family)
MEFLQQWGAPRERKHTHRRHCPWPSGRRSYGARGRDHPAWRHQSVVIPAGSETLLLSGMVPTPIAEGKTDSFAAFGNTKTQTIAVMERIKAALKDRGYAMSDVVKLTVFLVGDPALGGKMDFAGMNEAYKMYFGSADNKNLVTRSTIQVAALAAPYYLVEIEATAAKAPK